MIIILNEHEWAAEAINSCSLGKKQSETFSHIARYFLDQNYSKPKVKQLLETFLLKCDTSASIPKWTPTIEYAIRRASKHDTIRIDSIDITQPEMDKIDSLDGKQIKRLAFTLLCLSKYWDAVNPNCDHWINNKDTEIMRLANISTSVKRQSQMYHDLNKLKMIRFSKKIDNTNVRVEFITPGKTVLSISDFRNLGYQYLKYHGESFFECANCGITVRCKNNGVGRKQKYCNDCAMKIHMQQKINSAMRKNQ